MQDSSNNYELNHEDLVKLFNLAKQLKVALEKQDTAKLEELTKHTDLLYLLLEYLILNMDSPNVDKEILGFLIRFFTLRTQELQEFLDGKAEEERLNEKREFETLMRFVIYEIYKMTSPRQLAGETAMQNFVKNVELRGLEEALKYEGKEFVKNFALSELKGLELQGRSFVDTIKSVGVRGAGLDR